MSGYRVAINEMVTDKLQPGDPRWATFNDSFRNQELDVLDFANAIYTGHAYTTWHNGRRKRDTFIMGQHLAPDFDTEDERSSFDTLLSHPFVAAFSSFVHSTPSHQPGKPRSRVVFLLDKPITDPVAYEAAMAFLLTMFPAADQSTKDASRFYYGAKDCEIEMVGKVLPLNILRTYAKRWRMAHKQQMPPAAQRSNKILRMDDARAQRIAQTSYGDSPPNLQEFERALNSFDPYAVNYNQWIGIIAAAKRDLGPEAFGIVERWAQGKPGEVQREWDRVDVNRSGNVMHINTIFYLAKTLSGYALAK